MWPECIMLYDYAYAYTYKNINSIITNNTLLSLMTNLKYV